MARLSTQDREILRLAEIFNHPGKQREAYLDALEYVARRIAELTEAVKSADKNDIGNAPIPGFAGLIDAAHLLRRHFIKG